MKETHPARGGNILSEYYKMVDTALSDTQVRQIAREPSFQGAEAFNPNIITYTQLQDIDDIDDILSDDGTCVILFQEQNDHTGHYCCVFKRGNTICFFDPYGVEPDLQKTYFGRGANQRYYQTPELAKLLIQSPYKIDYNDVQIQQDGNDIATCGRHCVLRMWCRELTNGQYVNWLKQRMKNTKLPVDLIATLLTNHQGF